MKRVWIFGAGRTGGNIFRQIQSEVSVEGFLDNDTRYWGTEKEGLPIIGNAEALRGQQYDEVIIASLTALPVMRRQLLEAGVDPSASTPPMWRRSLTRVSISCGISRLWISVRLPAVP